MRNYEDRGALPAAVRTPSGYRSYTSRHAAALRAYLALIAGHGHPRALRVMVAVNSGDLPTALAAIDAGHVQLSRDRGTLAVVRTAIRQLIGDGRSVDPQRPNPSPVPVTSIGALAARLRISPATLRAWEAGGILRPDRDPVSDRRLYRPADVRDAELTHLLRRGHQPVAGIAVVIEQIRAAGGTEELASTLDGWQQQLTLRGSAMLRAAAQLAHYLDGS